MNTRTNKIPHLPLWIGAIAAILVSGVAIGSLAISAQAFDAAAAPAAPPEAAAAPAVAARGERAYRCAECGVIESMRKIEAPAETSGVDTPARIADGNRGKPLQEYEISVRMQDGSRRVITDANPAQWRLGERVTIIAGVD